MKKLCPSDYNAKIQATLCLVRCSYLQLCVLNSHGIKTAQKPPDVGFVSWQVSKEELEKLSSPSLQVKVTTSWVRYSHPTWCALDSPGPDSPGDCTHAHTCGLYKCVSLDR